MAQTTRSCPKKLEQMKEKVKVYSMKRHFTVVLGGNFIVDP